MHSATSVHSSQLAFTSSLQLRGGRVVISLGGLLVVASVVVVLSAGDTVVSAGVDSKLLELSFSAGVLLLLLLLLVVKSWSFGSPETDAKALME